LVFITITNQNKVLFFNKNTKKGRRV
jgi:hypothetical protein